MGWIQNMEKGTLIAHGQQVISECLYYLHEPKDYLRSFIFNFTPLALFMNLAVQNCSFRSCLIKSGGKRSRNRPIP